MKVVPRRRQGWLAVRVVPEPQRRCIDTGIGGEDPPHHSVRLDETAAMLREPKPRRARFLVRVQDADELRRDGVIVEELRGPNVDLALRQADGIRQAAHYPASAICPPARPKLSAKSRAISSATVAPA